VNYFALKLVITVLVFPVFVYAHGGRTNAEGCHTNRKTGEYHCHGSGTSSRPVQLRSSEENMTCGSKYYCKEMTSCEEAQYYLNQCGLTRLDGDGDGIPCESICGN